jgi:hypothetical protein
MGRIIKTPREAFIVNTTHTSLPCKGMGTRYHFGAAIDEER